MLSRAGKHRQLPSLRASQAEASPICSELEDKHKNVQEPDGISNHLLQEKKFAGSESKEYKRKDVVLYREKLLISEKLICLDGQVLTVSCAVAAMLVSLYVERHQHKLTDKQISKLRKYMMLKNIEYRPFYLNIKDMRWIYDNVDFLMNIDKDTLRPLDNRHQLPNITELAELHQLDVYLRTVTSTLINPDAHRRIFVEDLLDIIPILLKQQGNPINEAGKQKIRKYRVELQGDIAGHSTVDLKKLDEILDDFDVDKTKLTLAPEVTNLVSREQMMMHPRDQYLHVLSPYCYSAIEVSHAVFSIFAYIVCDVNWSREYCSKHTTCKQDFKTMIIAVMREYLSMGEETYVDLHALSDKINHLKTHCNYQIRRDRAFPPMVNLFEIEPRVPVKMSYFLAECKTYGIHQCLHPVSATVKQIDQAFLPAWKARVLFMLGWMDNFFDEDMDDLKRCIRKAINFKVPLKTWESEEDLMVVILEQNQAKLKLARECLTTISKCEHADPHDWLHCNRKRRERHFIVCEYKNPGIWHSSEILKISLKILRQCMGHATLDLKEVNVKSENKIGSDASPDVPLDKKKLKRQKQKLRKAAEPPEPTPPPPPPVIPVPEAKPCEKCFRTSERCNKANAELKTSLNKIKILEKKLSAEKRAFKENQETWEKKLEELQTELQAKERTIQEFQDKVAPKCAESVSDGFLRDGEELIATFDVTSSNATEEFESECIICREDIDLENGTVQCPRCTEIYHSHVSQNRDSN